MNHEADAGGQGLPVPFEYSSSAHCRRHDPCGYAVYQEYKPWLRDDFTFRCVYCLVRERWYHGDPSSFSIDHVSPQVSHPDGVVDYRNMVYACRECNPAKQDVQLLDPTTDALGEHLSVQDDGSIEALTEDGQDLIDQLGLDRERRRRLRRHFMDIIDLKAASILTTPASTNTLFTGMLIRRICQTSSRRGRRAATLKPAARRFDTTSNARKPNSPHTNERLSSNT